MGTLNVDFNNINLDDINFDRDVSKTINHYTLMALRNRFK